MLFFVGQSLGDCSVLDLNDMYEHSPLGRGRLDTIVDDPFPIKFSKSTSKRQVVEIAGNYEGSRAPNLSKDLCERAKT